ncbi:ankyrin repeat and SOCS box protein 1 [Trichechus manatus latirostris]|uniref:Ankyrin repeat and SOCS box protein 1 n=1 Tax=Trichechus manatus latirostris TaxID=127582 RepID=A0A2Y9E5G8_TRIMA|nr:ankyrin repeat and SOCS box protein 1 [Trichechus manatus latirostris]
MLLGALATGSRALWVCTGDEVPAARTPSTLCVLLPLRTRMAVAGRRTAYIGAETNASFLPRRGLWTAGQEARALISVCSQSVCALAPHLEKGLVMPACLPAEGMLSEGARDACLPACLLRACSASVRGDRAAALSPGADLTALLLCSFCSRINEKSVWCCGWLPCTPLRIAATAGHGNCVDFLIRKGAEVDLVDVKGQTALYVAVVNGHLESAQILLEAGADPNGSRHHRSTPVYHAARVGRADILKALIRYGADVDVNHHLTPEVRPPFSRRLTSLVVCPLYISAAYHNLQCFKLLLQAGANPDFNCNGPVNTQGFYRGSPGCVMDAVLRHGCEAAFVSLLVEFGANLSLVKWESLGPESRGRRKVDPEALQVFKEARSIPRTLLGLCRVAVRRALGKYRLHLISSLPLPDPIKKFLLYE